MKMQTGITLLLSIVIALTIVSADEEQPIPVSDTGEGTRCDKDMSVAQTCFRCSRLPSEIAVKLTDCCMVDKAYDLCERCVEKTSDCLYEAYSIADDATFDSEPDVSNDDVGGYPYLEEEGVLADDDRYPRTEKRFGTLHFGGGTKSNRYPNWWRGKRWGTLHFGKGNSNRHRYRSWGKRNGEELDDGLGVDKRFGTLFMSRGGGGHNGYKRYGSLFLGKSRSRGRNW